MTDIAVTIPRDRWPDFIAAPALCAEGAPRSHVIYGARPPCAEGDTLYFVSHRRLRAGLTIERITAHRGGFLVVGSFRPGITVIEDIAGFQGWQRAGFRPREIVPFPDWQTAGLFYPKRTEAVPDYAHGKSRSQQGGSSA